MDPIQLDIPEDALCRIGGFDWASPRPVPIGGVEDLRFFEQGAVIGAAE